MVFSLLSSITYAWSFGGWGSWSRPSIPSFSSPSYHRPSIPSYHRPSIPSIPTYHPPSIPSIPTYHPPSIPSIPTYHLPSTPSYHLPSRRVTVITRKIPIKPYCNNYGCTIGTTGEETTRIEGEPRKSELEQLHDYGLSAYQDTQDDVIQIGRTIHAKPTKGNIVVFEIHVHVTMDVDRRTGKTTTKTERWIKFHDQKAVIFGPTYITTDDGDTYKKVLITSADDPSLGIGESYWAYKYVPKKEGEMIWFLMPTSSSSGSSCYCTSWKEVNCGEGGCSQTDMLYTRSCNPSGCAAESVCVSHPKCTIKCYTNSDCKDSDPCTADICHNPGTVRSYCSNEYYCEGTNISCGCTSCVNCNEKDGWYNISTYNCCDGDRCATCHDQEYRDYYCFNYSCKYKVSNTRTWKSYCADVKISPTIMNVALGSKNADVSTIKILNKCNYTMNLTIKLIAKDYPLSINWLNFKTGNSECKSIENCKETEIIVGDHGESSTTLHLEKAERVGKYEYEVYVKDNVKGETYKTRVWLNVFSEAIGMDNLFLLLILLTLSVFIIYKYDHKK